LWRNDRHDPFVGAWTFEPERSDIVANDLIFTRAPGRKDLEMRQAT
jgi:hypothetical protein